MREIVKYEKTGSYGTITIDDGRANVMSIEMLAAINGALDRAEQEKVSVLLCGREKVFSGGFDLAAFQQGQETLFNMLYNGAKTIERLLSYPHPVVAAISGHAIAMGLFLVLAADLRIGARGDYRLHANEVEIGLTLPRFAVEVCRQRLTPAALNLVTALAEPYNPEEAREAGMLDLLVAKEDLLGAARDKTASLARLDQAAHTATKQRVRANTLKGMQVALEADVAEWQSFFS